MKFSDYEAAWKRQPLPRGADADLRELNQTFETTRRKMAATLLLRDWAELLACGIVVVAYVAFWRQAGPDGWPMGIAILMIVSVAGMFIRERLRSRCNRLGADAPLLAKIAADLNELRHQRRLLLRVWLWYIAPCAVAILIHVTVIMRRAPQRDLVRHPVSLLAIALVIGALCWFVWIINRRAVQRHIEPRIAELEKLQRDQLSAE
jgi:cytochrome bd-type quinol oxidase subunit 2